MVEETIIEVDITPKWEDLMPRYFEVLARKPVVNADQELLDLVKAECMRAAIQMDRISSHTNEGSSEELTSSCGQFQPAELTSATSIDLVDI
jgi:hypothetical protein